MTLGVPSVQLRTGYEMPVFGLGTWKSAALNEVEEAVKTAIQCGYRHIDCAKIYENEKEVGNALKHCMTYGGVKREDLFVTSKLWNSDHAAEDVRKACVQTLQDLQLDYLDLYLMHSPATVNVGPIMEPSIKETWLAMEKLVQDGLVRSIGISNFSIKKTEELLQYCTIIPAVNQIELHPFLRQEALLPYFKEKGIHVTAYSPLGSPDSADILQRHIAPNLLTDPIVTEIAEKLGKNAGQILLRWGLQRDTSVLVKSVKPERIKSNIELFDWEIPQGDHDRLSSFDIQFRMVPFAFVLNPEGPYKTLGELWDDPEEDTRLEKYIQSLYTMNVTLPKIEIAPGIQMPLLGLGTWRSETNVIKDVVLKAIRLGYRHIDCAEIYENEHEVGEALEQVFREGIVKREDLWITSKLWNADHGRDKVLPAVKKSLGNLKLDYLDLYLVHWPVSGNIGPEVLPPIEETWHAMEELVDSGIARSIGISNFSIPKMQDVLRYARIKPAVNQVEIHPYFRNDALVEWCKENGIHVTAYSPLGGSPESEQLTEKALPRLIEDKVVEEVAQRTGKSKGQVLIRWGLQHGTSVLPKSVKTERIKMNQDVFDWSLSPEDYEALSHLEPQTRMLDPVCLLHPDGPYTTSEQLWNT